MRKIQSASDIDALHGSVERRTLEIKSKPLDTQKLIESIQSFANGITTGGHIILGLTEDPSTQKVDAKKPLGVTYPIVFNNRQTFRNFDEYRRHLMDSCRSATEPYREGLFEVYTLDSQVGELIVIEIPQSPDRPHYNTHCHKYFIRTDAGKRPMTSAEIDHYILERKKRKPFFLQRNEETVDSRSSFLNKNEVIITRDNSNQVVWENGAHVFLRLLPVNNICKWPAQQLNTFISTPRVLEPLGIHSYDSHAQCANKYGAVSFVQQDISGSNKNAECITQVFKNGELWGLDGRVLKYVDEPKVPPFIPCEKVEKLLESALTAYLKFAKNKLGLSYPFKFIVGLNGIKGYCIALPRPQGFKHFDGEPCSEDLIYYQDEIIDNEQSIKQLLLPFFELMWESCGLERSKYVRT